MALASADGATDRGHGQIADLLRRLVQEDRPLRRAEGLRRQLEPAARAGDLQPPRHRAGAVGDACLQRGQRLRPRPGERPRPRRLHRPGDRLPGQRQLHGAALLDRRLQARQRDAGHGGHPLLLLRQGRQEGRAAGLDPGPRLRRLHRGGRGRPRPDDGPAQPADPGLLQDPRRPPLRDAGPGRLLPREGDPRPGRRRRPTSASASRRTSSPR